MVSWDSLLECHPLSYAQRTRTDFGRRQKIGVKIGSCVPTVGLIKI